MLHYLYISVAGFLNVNMLRAIRTLSVPSNVVVFKRRSFFKIKASHIPMVLLATPGGHMHTPCVIGVLVHINKKGGRDFIRI